VIIRYEYQQLHIYMAHIYDGHQENRNYQMSSLIRDRKYKCQRVGGDLDLLLGLCQDNRNLFDNRYIDYSSIIAKSKSEFPQSAVLEEVKE
jgi:hypothetical protein